MNGAAHLYIVFLLFFPKIMVSRVGQIIFQNLHVINSLIFQHQGVRANMEAWLQKLECGGDLEKQAFFKKKFITRLRDSPVAIETEKANEQHYEVPTELFLTVSAA